MDYSPGAGGLQHPYFHCRREADYYSFYNSGALPGPLAGEGFWQASADLAFPALWLEDDTRSGMLLVGQRTSRDTWYGLAAERNTFDASGNFTGRVAVDPPDTMALDQGSTGYHSNGWQSAMWTVSSANLRQVATGSRKASADGMRPSLRGAWNTRWPEIPRPSKRPYVEHEGFVYDDRADQLIWCHGRSKLIGYSIVPTVHVFDV